MWEPEGGWPAGCRRRPRRGPPDAPLLLPPSQEIRSKEVEGRRSVRGRPAPDSSPAPPASGMPPARACPSPTQRSPHPLEPWLLFSLPLSLSVFKMISRKHILPWPWETAEAGRADALRGRDRETHRTKDTHRTRQAPPEPAGLLLFVTLGSGERPRPKVGGPGSRGWAPPAPSRLCCERLFGAASTGCLSGPVSSSVG